MTGCCGIFCGGAGWLAQHMLFVVADLRNEAADIVGSLWARGRGCWNICWLPPYIELAIAASQAMLCLPI